VGGMPSELAVGMTSVANDTRTLPQGSWILVGKLVVAILDRKFGVRVPVGYLDCQGMRELGRWTRELPFQTKP